MRVQRTRELSINISLSLDVSVDPLFAVLGLESLETPTHITTTSPTVVVIVVHLALVIALIIRLILILPARQPTAAAF